MKRLLALGMVCGFGLLQASQASAIVGLEVMAGQRNSKFSNSDDKENIAATEIQTAIHVDPIPMVPLAIGVYYIMHDYKPEKDGKVLGLKEYGGSEMGAELYAWLPLKPTDFSLFAKAGYTFLGNYEGKYTDYPVEGGNVDLEVKTKVTGTKLGLGMKWSPIALVSAMLQVDYSMETAKVDEVKIDNVVSKALADAAEDIDISSFTVLLGFGLKI